MSKYFLVEFDTKPVATLRTQAGPTLASVAIMAENGGLDVKSIREESFDGILALERSGVEAGLCGLKG